jgi:PAS domain-containing protein
MTCNTPHHKRSENLLQVQNDLIRELGSISSLDEALNRILAVVIKLNNAKAAALYILDEKTEEMRLSCHQGLSERFTTAHQTIAKGIPEYDNLLRSVPITEGTKAALVEEGIRSAAIYPIKHRNQPVAAVCVGAEHGDLPSADIHNTIEAVCAHLGGIVSRLKTEAALQASENSLRQMYSNMPIPAYTWRNAGDHFVLVDSNPAAHRFTKGGVNQIMGIKASDYFTDRPDILESLWECYREQRLFQLTYPFQFKYMDAKKYLRVTFTYSSPDQVIAYTEDITKERSALDELRLANLQLKVEQEELQKKHIALEQILETIREERDKTGQQIQANLESRITPLLKRLEEGAATSEKNYIHLIQKSLAEITSPFVNQLLNRFRNLSPRELEICNFIVQGLTTKEIAQTLNVALETVRTQRKSIRKKLDITSKNVNLQTFLMRYFTDLAPSIDDSGSDN